MSREKKIIAENLLFPEDEFFKTTKKSTRKALAKNFIPRSSSLPTKFVIHGRGYLTNDQLRTYDIQNDKNSPTIVKQYNITKEEYIAHVSRIDYYFRQLGWKKLISTYHELLDYLIKYRVELTNHGAPGEEIAVYDRVVYHTLNYMSRYQNYNPASAYLTRLDNKSPIRKLISQIPKVTNNSTLKSTG